ncbi:MAG: hypothetical protein IPK00_20685 [Deltaproteobacteria bacterium]|nr:hypothetical protein [Deltaproteobacteria bacterium]
MKIRPVGNLLAASAILLLVMSGAARADQVFADDLIVQGSLCVGFDCVNDEPFPYDMIRLKENNLRIAIRDASDPDSSAGGDWQITANDSASGGLNWFSFDDLSSGTIPFRIAGGAPTDSLYLAATGRLGLGTTDPESTLHVGGSLRIDGDLVVTGGLRAGRVEAASLTRDGRATVTFAVPYARDYAITLTPLLANAKGNPNVVVVSRDENGFTFAIAGKPSDYAEIVWTTRFTGEF